MKWYQVLLMIFGVYVISVIISRAIQNQRDLNSLRNGMNENLCLLIKQLKKYDTEIKELEAEVPVTLPLAAANPGGSTGPIILPVDPAVLLAKINELKAKRASILAMISKITTENPYTVYCKPCDCEKHNEEPHGDLPPGGMTSAQAAIINSGNGNGNRVGLNVPSGRIVDGRLVYISQ